MTAAARQPGPHHTTQHEDAAWVEITTALSVADLRGFLNDIERLYRINPLLEISAFEATGGSTYRFAAHNLSNGRQIDLVLAVTQSETAVEVRYSDGVKVSTSFRAEPAEGGARLLVTDVYGRVSQERAPRACPRGGPELERLGACLARLPARMGALEVAGPLVLVHAPRLAAYETFRAAHRLDDLGRLRVRGGRLGRSLGGLAVAPVDALMAPTQVLRTCFGALARCDNSYIRLFE